ncbi:unnamed protein product [Cunninghamella blakesleeana]
MDKIKRAFDKVGMKPFHHTNKVNTTQPNDHDYNKPSIINNNNDNNQPSVINNNNNNNNNQPSVVNMNKNNDNTESVNKKQPLHKSKSTFEPYDEKIAEIYRYRQHIGVNVGSLFILESWLCPPTLKNSVLQGNWSSELDFLHGCKKEGKDAKALLEHHWRTYITNDDIDFIEQQGMNAIRLPISYWMIHPLELLSSSDPFYEFRSIYQHTWDDYLLPLLHYCEKKKIGVLIDIHGLPGGQNNDFHCGMLTLDNKKFLQHPKVSFFKSSQHQSLYFNILTYLMKQIMWMNHIIGIELINEPVNDPQLPLFYEKACQHILGIYQQQQQKSSSYLPIYLSDGWKPGDYINKIAANQFKYPFLVLDTHQYFCHNASDHQKTYQQHKEQVENKLGPFLSRQQQDGKRNNFIIGEWSMVLNGQSMKDLDQRQTMKQFGDCQVKVWQSSHIGGYFYWNYRTGDDKWYWSLKYCIKENLVPWLRKNNNRTKPFPFLLNDSHHPHHDHHEKEKEWKEQQLKQCQQDYLPHHLNYWKEKTSLHQYQPIEQHGWLYEQGFKDGLNVAVTFFKYSTTFQIGFLNQLVYDYRSRYLASNHKTIDQHYLWEYDHGFTLAIEKVESLLN